MSLNFPSQSHFLFDSKWDLNKDSVFINLILKDFAMFPDDKNPNIPIPSLCRARRGMNERFNLGYSWDEICSRYAKLKDRYRTFKALDG